MLFCMKTFVILLRAEVSCNFIFGKMSSSNNVTVKEIHISQFVLTLFSGLMQTSPRKPGRGESLEPKLHNYDPCPAYLNHNLSSCTSGGHPSVLPNTAEKEGGCGYAENG